MAGTLHDRSILSDEMAALCAKLPIYRLYQESAVIGVEKQKHLSKLNYLLVFQVVELLITLADPDQGRQQQAIKTTTTTTNEKAIKRI